MAKNPPLALWGGPLSSMLERTKNVSAICRQILQAAAVFGTVLQGMSPSHILSADVLSLSTGGIQLTGHWQSSWLWPDLAPNSRAWIEFVASRAEAYSTPNIIRPRALRVREVLALTRRGAVAAVTGFDPTLYDLEEDKVAAAFAGWVSLPVKRSFDSISSSESEP